MLESEYRSHMVLNLEIFEVCSFFTSSAWSRDTREILYVENYRFSDGALQKKTVLDRECASLFPGVKTTHVLSYEHPPEKMNARCVMNTSGRSLLSLLSNIYYSPKKFVFTNIQHEEITAKIYVTINPENKPLTVLNLECEHSGSSNPEFLFRTGVGTAYRKTLKQLWTTYNRDIVVYKRNVGQYFDKEGYSKPILLPINDAHAQDILHGYYGFLPKLDGVPGHMTFKNNMVTLKLADGTTAILHDEKSFLNYYWTDLVCVRVEKLDTTHTLTESVYATDVITGAYGERMSSLPYIYRHKYLKYLKKTILENVRVNTVVPGTRGIRNLDLKECDGILLVKSLLSVSHLYKVKWLYTVDVTCRDDGTFLSREGTVYNCAELYRPGDVNFEVGCIYECRILDDLTVWPIKPRRDKHVPDSNEIIQSSNSLNKKFRISDLWKDNENEIGNRELLRI